MRLNDDELYKLDYINIGSGRFTTAYRKRNTDRIYLRSTCPFKKAIADKLYKPNRFLSDVEYSDNPEFDYMMKYEPEFNRNGIRMRLNAYGMKMYSTLTTYHEYYGSLDEISFRRFVKGRGLNRKDIDTLCDMINVGYYVIPKGSILMFDACVRNLGVTSGGGLMMLDCFTYIEE